MDRRYCDGARRVGDSGAGTRADTAPGRVARTQLKYHRWAKTDRTAPAELVLFPNAVSELNADQRSQIVAFTQRWTADQ